MTPLGIAPLLPARRGPRPTWYFSDEGPILGYSRAIIILIFFIGIYKKFCVILLAM
jgi:hypothetical protein